MHIPLVYAFAIGLISVWYWRVEVQSDFSVFVFHFDTNAWFNYEKLVLSPISLRALE